MRRVGAGELLTLTLTLSPTAALTLTLTLALTLHPVPKQDGQCEENPLMMYKECPIACGVCTPDCKDTKKQCAGWAESGGCNDNPGFMALHCPVTCGVCKDKCKDRAADCPGWTAQGECFNNAQFMCARPVHAPHPPRTPGTLLHPPATPCTLPAPSCNPLHPPAPSCTLLHPPCTLLHYCRLLVSTPLTSLRTRLPGTTSAPRRAACARWDSASTRTRPSAPSGTTAASASATPSRS